MWTPDQARSVAALIREARLDAGLTQKELAAAAGVSEPSIQNLERGQQLKYRDRTLARVARALAGAGQGVTFLNSDGEEVTTATWAAPGAGGLTDESVDYGPGHRYSHVGDGETVYRLPNSPGTAFGLAADLVGGHIDGAGTVLGRIVSESAAIDPDEIDVIRAKIRWLTRRVERFVETLEEVDTALSESLNQES
jgi:transcriptional regulator with XRE-family HTH domain